MACIPRKLGIRKVDFDRAVTICLEPRSVVPLAFLVCMVLIMYENIRWCVRSLQHHSRNRLKTLVLFGVSLYPIVYNHDVLFLYWNDQWITNLFFTQVLLTLTDNLCLIGRWRETWWHGRLMARAAHVLFNLFVESNKLSLRNALFLLDDAASLLVIIDHFRA